MAAGRHKAKFQRFRSGRRCGDGGERSVNEPSLTLSLLSVARNGVISSLENVFKQRR